MDRVRLTELFLYPPFSPFIIKEVGLNKSSWLLKNILQNTQLN
jgi:hypothetical protein